MKKFTFAILAALLSVVAFAQKQAVRPNLNPFKVEQTKLKAKCVSRTSLQPVASTRRHSGGEDGLVQIPDGAQPITLYTSSGKFWAGGEEGFDDATSDMPSINVVISGNEVYIQGLAYWFKEGWIQGTFEGSTATFPSGQLIGSDEIGDEFIVGSEDGETIADIVFTFDQEAGTLTAVTPLIVESGASDELQAFCYWESPVFSLEEPVIEEPQVVVLPDGVVTEEYVISARNYADDADVTAPLSIGFDGTDVYIQGLSSYLSEAWVKGTLDGTTITFPKGQYFGSYAGTYDMYLNTLVGEDVVFSYDEETSTLTAQNEFFLVDNPQYYFDSYRGAVITKVAEKATIPANPAITDMINSQYGWYINFNVPAVDINGEGLLTSKLYYMFYTDVEGEILPLTFTPDTHSRLTENMVEIPYGFTENYDFYNNQIYLNDLYSADWNNIGIQSIYAGGGELNATEIQWYHIKDYTVPAGPVEGTFNFNEMELATSSGVTTDGDITEAVTFTENNVTLTISPKDGSSTPNRFWDTNNGPQLRVYSGTLTFEVPEGYVITQIVFNHNGKWGANTVEDVEIPNNTEAKAATWTGSAQTVVVTIAGNSQINSIIVTCEQVVVPEEAIDPDGITFTFDDGTLQGWTAIDADGDGYNWAITTSLIAHHNDEGYAVFSQSYDEKAKALTPDNYLVSPKIKLGSKLRFFACAQDASYPEEHFGVAVSTTDKAVENFQMINEWDLKAVRRNGPRKASGTWYEYIVDLSNYAGEEGYVAIRHFNCTDMFYIVVDDISFGDPEFEIDPAEGVATVLGEFILTFNKYNVVVTDGATATLTNETTGTSKTGTVNGGGDKVTVSVEATDESGTYTLTVTGVQTETGEDLDLSFNYYIKMKPIILPAGAEPEEYTLDITQYQYNQGWQSVGGKETALVAFDGDDVYVSGLAYWFKESYVKGTKNVDGNYVFQANQFLGEDEYGEEYLVGTITVGEGEEAEETVSDYVFLFDEETRSLTLADGYTHYESGAVNDIENIYTFATGAVYTPGAYVLPDVVELPEGAEVNTWFLSASDNSEAAVSREVGVAFVENDIYVQGLCEYLPEAWVKGTIDGETATFATGQFYGTYNETNYLFFLGYGEADQAFKDVVFTYDAEKGLLTTEDMIVLAGDEDAKKTYEYYTDVVISRDRPDSFPVEAPEDLKTETYLFSAMEVIPVDDDSSDGEQNVEVVNIDFNAMDIITSSNDSSEGDIIESQTLTAGAVTLTISPKDESATTQNRFWSTANGPQLRVYSGTLTFEVPEGSTMTQIVFNAGKWNDGNTADNGTFEGTTWSGNEQAVTVNIAGNTQLNSIVVTVAEGGDEPEPQYTLKEYSYQTEVGFDGNDVYFKGFSANTADYYAKGTLSEDGKTVTIPACQYMGQLSFWGYTFDYFITAIDEEGNMVDLVLDYDAETSTFTTKQIMVLNDSKTELNPYQTFTDVKISKMPDLAATPADPVLEKYDFEQEVGYNKIYASIPTTDVDGNDLQTSKLFYIVWIEKDGKTQPYTFTTELYAEDFDEDVTEVPYSHDGYDIYSGGEIIYLEESLEELATWTKVGIQSIYYGGGERNTSNIVWEEISTGINSLFQDEKNVVIYNIAGQRVQKAQKGLYIVNGKKIIK